MSTVESPPPQPAAAGPILFTIYWNPRDFPGRYVVRRGCARTAS